ncbi:MAG: YdcF family protein [Clostridia bacterium]|nr:YdcF family protein [Clostridia bacterium]
MQIVLIALGVFCLAYYTVSVIYAGFGASIIWIWLIGGIALLVLGGALLYIKKHGIVIDIPFSLKCILATTFVCVLGFFIIMEGLIISGMNQKGEPDLDYIIVLGCQVKGERPSRSLKERLDKAEEYLVENPETKAILSGGQGPGEDISEAECMYQYLVDAGISSERLLMESQSTTTVENLKNSQLLLNEEQSTVGIVTNNFHVYRSIRLAKKFGYVQVCGIAAPSGSVLQLHFMVREFFALTKELVQKNI